ncbi:mCG1033990 [Mus musculus]|nr:mCG1033990 [Mus musculus]
MPLPLPQARPSLGSEDITAGFSSPGLPGDGFRMVASQPVWPHALPGEISPLLAGSRGDLVPPPSSTACLLFLKSHEKGDNGDESSGFGRNKQAVCDQEPRMETLAST